MTFALRNQDEVLAESSMDPGSARDPEAEQVTANVGTRAETEISAVLSERRIGSYKLLHELGIGGFGVVFLAARADEEYEKRVAIKIIRGAGTAEREAIDLFRRERQIMATLEHPNIARLLDGGATEDGLPYLVMEYVEGLPVGEYCDSRRLPIAGRLKLFQQVCSAVSFAHRNLIVHRDLKPGNILVTPEGTPKLLDFGIAKILNPELSGEAATAAMAMTPEYASPEQVRGEPVGTASDIYALGVILYELLTGRCPYRVTSRQTFEILKAICEEQPEKPSTVIDRTENVVMKGKARRVTPESVSSARDITPGKLRRRLSGDLDNIVMMALRKEPHRRYVSVDALSADVQSYLDGIPVEARKSTAAYRTGKFVRRHAVGVAAAATFLALLVAFSVVMAIQRNRAALERDKAEKVSAFLVDLFKAPDPFQAKGDAAARGNSVTAREILDKGADRIKSELQDKPKVQAMLMFTMGKAYFDLGLYDKAEDLLRSALEIRKRTLGNEHLDVAATLEQMTWVLLYKGDYARAEEAGREALAMRRKLLGNEHPDVAESLYTLGRVLWDRGRHAEAEALLREALPMQRKLLGNEHADVAATIYMLGWVQRGKDDLAGADALFREALAMRRKVLGNDHPDVANTLRVLADVVDDEGDYREAESLCREALAMQRKRLGNEHPNVAKNLILLAGILDHEGHYVEAEARCREGLEMQRKLLGNDHPEVAATTLPMLAMILAHKGDYAEAEAAGRKALEMQRKLLGEGDFFVTRVLGSILTDEGRPGDGEPFLRNAYETASRTLPAGDLALARVKSELGGCLLRLQKYPEAETLLLQSFSTMKAKCSERRPEMVRVRKRLVELYETEGKPATAAAYRARG